MFRWATSPIGIPPRMPSTRSARSTAIPTSSSTMPASPATDCSARCPWTTGGRHRHQPELDVQRHQAGPRRHAGEGLGQDHQHLLGQRPEGPVRPDQLLHRQGGPARLHHGAGPGGAKQGGHRQHGLPGLYCHRDGPRHPAGRAGQDHRHDPGAPARHARGNRADGRLACRRRNPVLQPARTSRSTADCTWGDRSCRTFRPAILQPPEPDTWQPRRA